MTAGSAVGAALVTIAGPTVAFAVNAVSFCVDVLLLWSIRVGPSPRVGRAPGQIRAGLRYVWHAPALRTALLTLAAIATLSVVLLGGMAAGGPIASAVIAFAGPRAAFALGAVSAVAALCWSPSTRDASAAAVPPGSGLA